MNEKLEHWKWIVKAVFTAEHNVQKRGYKINKDSDDKEAEAERWVTLVAEEILSRTSNKKE